MFSALDGNQISQTPEVGDVLQPGPNGTKINLLHVPKSVELFELYLHHLASTATPETPAPAQILDPGCGNGIIGDYLLGRYPAAHLTAYDISRVATASTQLNLNAHGYTDRATVLEAGSLDEIKGPARFDLIVTNPPFHDEFQTDISVSTDLFLAASDRLNPGGHLVVVANRHLNYATHLRRYFDEVLVVAENEKFVVYREPTSFYFSGPV